MRLGVALPLATTTPAGEMRYFSTSCAGGGRTRYGGVLAAISRLTLSIPPPSLSRSSGNTTPPTSNIPTPPTGSLYPAPRIMGGSVNDNAASSDSAAADDVSVASSDPPPPAPPSTQQDRGTDKQKNNKKGRFSVVAQGEERKVSTSGREANANRSP